MIIRQGINQFSYYSRLDQKILDTALLAIIQYNKWISIVIELEISGGFSFGGYDYQLNLKIDDLTHKNINVHILKFTSSDIVTELIFMKGFIKRCTSIIQTITPDKDLANLKYPKGITYQNQIQEILNNIDNKPDTLYEHPNLQKTFQSIVCINSESSGIFWKQKQLEIVYEQEILVDNRVYDNFIFWLFVESSFFEIPNQ